MNYLRLRIMTENFDLYQQQVQEILVLEKTETVSMDRVMEMTILNDIAERWQDNICGILKEQNRKMYDTAALWLAALGEVLESRGVTGEKKEA